MVNYSIDTNIRTPVYFWIAVISVSFSYYIISNFSVYLNTYIFTAPSAAFIFGFLVYIFDLFIWKLQIINNLLGVPNLNGEWVGVVKRPLKNAESGYENLQATLLITQTWHKISLILETKITLSTVLIAGLFVQNKKNLAVRYAYLVMDKTGSSTENYYGEGTAELFLRFEDGKKILVGPYYSTKSIEGYLKFEFKQK